MAETIKNIEEELALPSPYASDLIFDEVSELDGLLSVLLDVYSRDKGNDTYWLFVALERPVSCLKEAMKTYDDYGYTRPDPKPKLKSVPKVKGPRKSSTKSKPPKRKAA